MNSKLSPERESRRWHVVRAFRNPVYRQLWVVVIINGFANWMTRLTVGWFVYDQTQSALLTALAFTMQSAPGLFVAPFGGAATDRFDRRHVLAISSFVKGLATIGLALVAIDGIQSVWPVVALVAAAGAVTSFEHPASQALIPDILGPDGAMNGIAVFSVGVRAIHALGAFIGGFLLEFYGPTVTLAVAAALYCTAAAVGARLPATREPSSLNGPRSSVMADVGEGLRTMVSLPTVRALLIMALFGEVLCFSYAAVLPALARDQLGLDESELGTLTAMASVGSVVGALGLARFSEYRHKGLMLICVAALYGASLVALGASGFFLGTIVVITVVGMMAALFDGLQWGLLQANVPDAMRGRAMGGWMFVVGFGWLGHLELGAVSDIIGPHWAIAIHGSLTMVVAAVALMRAKSLRRT